MPATPTGQTGGSTPRFQSRAPKARTASTLAIPKCSITQPPAPPCPRASAHLDGLCASDDLVTTPVSVRRSEMAVTASCALNLEELVVPSAARCAGVRGAGGMGEEDLVGGGEWRKKRRRLDEYIRTELWSRRYCRRIGRPDHSSQRYQRGLCRAPRLHRRSKCLLWCLRYRDPPVRILSSRLLSAALCTQSDRFGEIPAVSEATPPTFWSGRTHRSRSS